MKGTKPILDLNRFTVDEARPLNDRLAKLVRRRHQTQGASSVLFYQQPLEIVSASGVWMYDAAGKAYLDMYNNVPSVGHCHPRVVSAMSQQAARLSTNSRYLYPILDQYAESLLATFPQRLSNAVFTCTGSESNDIALRIAAINTGKHGFIVTEGAYHGNTSAVMAVSPSAYRRHQVPAHVRTIPAPNAYCLEPGQQLADVFATHVENAIQDLNAQGVGFAGLLVDTIFSSDGVFAEPAGFLKKAVDCVHKAGGLFIADEVQPGFGRAGEGLWCFDRHHVEPDIVTLGKPMGNGFPMSAVITRPELLDNFCQEANYFNTFGGNPVAAATGMAVLQVIEEEGLIENANHTGIYLRAGLKELAKRYSVIGDIRGAGLFNAVEFIHPDSRIPNTTIATGVINALKEENILIGAAGVFGNSLKIRPPLCFSQKNADYFLEKLEKVLSDCAPA
ncbi:aspartate aminotransferase family protein [Pectobacterium cacticida]|uniref:aspartate aminotransferase family protein n=1 Tax=Pectobacterium cacticida TaxID=69221 RepID=UPI003985FE81